MAWDERAQNDPALMEKLKNHWATFITADDIQQIADAGLNTVRIPVGYWSLLGGGISGEPYISGALEYLDPVIEKCAELGITVFIVLHGLPGSQNGQDNSGRAMGDNYEWFGNADHKAKSLETVDKAVELYGNGKFGGIVKSIELMNEPKPRWDSDDNLNFQKEYFKEAYENIRSKDKDINVMYSDGWRDPTEQSTWAGFGEGQTGVSMDTHIYTLFSEAAKYGYTKRLEYMCNKKDTLISENRNMQTIVGEWTVAIGMDCDDGDCQAEANDAYKDYLAKQFEWQTWLYEQASGWVYWNWKLDHDDAWSFQTGVKDGWIPKDLGDKPRGGTPCQF
jgi:glucan 1,3-beta-glucosidase